MIDTEEIRDIVEAVKARAWLNHRKEYYVEMDAETLNGTLEHAAAVLLALRARGWTTVEFASEYDSNQVTADMYKPATAQEIADAAIEVQKAIEAASAVCAAEQAKAQLKARDVASIAEHYGISNADLAILRSNR